jgi:tetratricopeptide (TPR) repeat protein
LALLYNNLGNCLVAAGDWTPARAAFEHSIAVYGQVQGADRRGAAMPLLSLGMLLRLQEAFGAARPLFERALRIDDETFGIDSGASGYTLARLGDLAHAEGDLDTAQPQLDRALAPVARGNQSHQR